MQIHTAHIQPIQVAAASLLTVAALGLSLVGIRSFVTPVLTARGTDGTPTIQAAPANRLSGGSYDFTKLPNGPLPKDEWNFEVGTKVASYNQESQAYTARPDNVRVENGALVIEARPEKFDSRNYTSARINTQGKFEFTYGTLEADMILPAGQGTWPAAWLMPAKETYKPEQFGIKRSDPLAWSLNGEIDFVEAIGSKPGQVLPAAHGYNEFHAAPTITPGFVSGMYSEYHRYGIIKTPDSITFTLDGTPYAKRTKTSDSALDWPFNQPYYLILNLAIGGNWAGQQGIDDSSAPWVMRVRGLTYKPL